MEQEFKDIYFKYHPRLLSVAYYVTKDQVVAEDICQEIFLKLWNRRETISEIASMEAYLVQMTKNESLNFIKDQKREESNLILLKKVNEDDNNQGPDLDEFKSALEKAVSRLSPQCRLIFSLSRFDGLNNDEIATHLGISKRTVETQISNALKLFRTDLRHLFTTVMSSFLPVLLVPGYYF